MFQAWTAELGKLGPDAVERGIRSIDLAGSSYAPNLNKFVSACRVSDGGAEGAGESYSEQLHGGRIKPTPDGLPLCYLADGDFSVAALRDTQHYEDAEVAHKMESSGWTYQEYRQNRCAELGLEYAIA